MDQTSTLPAVDAEPAAVVLAELREERLLVDELLDLVSGPAVGGISLFVGLVRDHDSGRSVAGLDYSAHPSAAVRLREVAEQVAGRHRVHTLAAVHRVGTLSIGDVAVIVAAGASHRGEAFAAARDLIDTLKSGVPVWKHQRFADGTEEWVGLP